MVRCATGGCWRALRLRYRHVANSKAWHSAYQCLVLYTEQLIIHDMCETAMLLAARHGIIYAHQLLALYTEQLIIHDICEIRRL